MSDGYLYLLTCPAGDRKHIESRDRCVHLQFFLLAGIEGLSLAPVARKHSLPLCSVAVLSISSATLAAIRDGYLHLRAQSYKPDRPHTRSHIQQLRRDHAGTRFRLRRKPDGPGLFAGGILKRDAVVANWLRRKLLGNEQSHLVKNVSGLAQNRHCAIPETNNKNMQRPVIAG